MHWNRGSPIITEPVPLNGSDRATVIFTVHSVEAPGAPVKVTCTAQWSDDRTTWFGLPGLGDFAVSPGAETKAEIPVHGAFVRLGLEMPKSEELARVCLALHVNLDRAKA